MNEKVNTKTERKERNGGRVNIRGQEVEIPFIFLSFSFLSISFTHQVLLLLLMVLLGPLVVGVWLLQHNSKA